MITEYIALIPAYEPDRKMLGIIADLGKNGFKAVVVDDGSGPEYSELFSQAAERLPGKRGGRVTLLSHSRNRGKGAALKTGLDYINNFLVHDEDADRTVIVTVDADGQHLAKDVLRTAREAAAKPGTLVLGGRGFDKDVPLRSRFGNTVTRSVFRLATGTCIYDTQTGLRAFTADMIPVLLRIRGDRYEYELNMLMEATAAGIPVSEIRIETVYHDGNEGSHFNTLRDSYRIYKEIAGFACARSNRSKHAHSGIAADDETRRENDMKAKGSEDGKGIIGTVKQALRFSASSFASFLIDYSAYTLLLLAGPGLIAANIGARLISSIFNFTVNRKLVFRSDSSAAGSAVQYFALAAFILAGNTFVLNTMVNSLGIGEMAAKVLTETIFFLISWTVQKYVIFYNDHAEEDGVSDAPAERFSVGYSVVRPKKLRNISRREIS